MAVIKTGSTSMRGVKHQKHPGVNSKCKTSKNKNSKNYVKPCRGQGR